MQDAAERDYQDVWNVSDFDKLPKFNFLKLDDSSGGEEEDNLESVIGKNKIIQKM